MRHQDSSLSNRPGNLCRIEKSNNLVKNSKLISARKELYSGDHQILYTILVPAFHKIYSRLFMQAFIYLWTTYMEASPCLLKNDAQWKLPNADATFITNQRTLGVHSGPKYHRAVQRSNIALSGCNLVQLQTGYQTADPENGSLVTSSPISQQLSSTRHRLRNKHNFTNSPTPFNSHIEFCSRPLLLRPPWQERSNSF